MSFLLYSRCCCSRLRGVSWNWQIGSKGVGMNIMYLITGLLALGLLVYLVVALLKPEWFS